MATAAEGMARPCPHSRGKAGDRRRLGAALSRGVWAGGLCGHDRLRSDFGAGFGGPMTSGDSPAPGGEASHAHAFDQRGRLPSKTACAGRSTSEQVRGLGMTCRHGPPALVATRAGHHGSTVPGPRVAGGVLSPVEAWVGTAGRSLDAGAVDPSAVKRPRSGPWPAPPRTGRSPQLALWAATAGSRSGDPSGEALQSNEHRPTPLDWSDHTC